MGAVETVSGLARFERRSAGSDAERRAALWLSEELRARGREVSIEPFWHRPNTALAQAWHVALGLGGSLAAVGSARVGGALILLALVSLVADATLGRSPGRRLTPERASQNVVSPAPELGHPKRVRLIVTANYDAGRMGLVYRVAPRAAAARLRALTGGFAPGWLGWIAIALIWLEVTALIRLGGTGGNGVGLLQLAPTVGLVLALAALIDVGTADISPAAGDNASGVAAAIGLVRALDAAPPANAQVELVLQGASDGTAAGLRAYLRRRELKAPETVVLGIAACPVGEARWWESDGPLFPLRYSAPLRALAAELAAREPELGLAAHKGRGTTPAYAARLRRLPAMTIGTLDARGLVPRSHEAGDTADTVQPLVIDRVVESGLLLVDAIDAHLRRTAPAPQPA